jgi:hypothetical protein
MRSTTDIHAMANVLVLRKYHKAMSKILNKEMARRASGSGNIKSAFEEVIATFEEGAAWSLGTPFEEVLDAGAVVPISVEACARLAKPSDMDLALVEFSVNIHCFIRRGGRDSAELKVNFYDVFMDAGSEVEDASEDGMSCNRSPCRTL